MSDVEDNGEEGAIESPNDNGPMSPSLQSEMEDAPPVAQPQQMSAEQLARHPVWLNSRSGQASPMPNARQRIPQGASKGGAKKKGTAAGADDYDAPRFERISAEALEMKAFQDMDGADSHLNSDDSDEDYAQVSADRRARENGPRRERRRQNDEGEDDDDEERPAGPLDEEDDAEEERSEHEMAASSGKKRRGGSGGVGSARGSGSAEDMMAAAAFGGGARRAFGESEADGRSETSSKRRKTAYKEAFPVRGVTCVGCAIATRITPVERFVKENIGRMTETALWKMAALCYKKDVAEPCEREGVVVPGWSWKDIQAHYTYHSTNNQIGRHGMLRQLQMLRAQCEHRLVRVENGQRELDRVGADMMLKILAAESRERQLLETKSKDAGRGGSSVVTRQED